MYRCTECNTEYTQCPDFCDCGNDTFVEIEDTYYEEPAESYKPASKKSKKPQYTPEELEEIEAEKLDKKKALIAIGVSIVVCLVLLACPPYMKKKADVVKKHAIASNIKLPSVETYWDNTLPSAVRKKDPNWNLPILNKHFGSISPVLRDYLMTVGSEFNRRWDARIVEGTGECKVEFTIDKEGGLQTKKIVVRSHNESLDDSVLLLLSKLNSFEIPPDDYKGERIIIGFKVDKNGASKIYFPTNKL